jgi:hypothetical protein
MDAAVEKAAAQSLWHGLIVAIPPFVGKPSINGIGREG